MAYNKEPKYNYLEHSFEKSLQRSYDRGQYRQSPSAYSPPNQRSPHRSPQRSSEFSPYENKEENVRERLLVQELKTHNRILTEQISEYKIMVDKLHAELRIRGDEYSALEKMKQNEKKLHQQNQVEMKEEISILLTKNSMLEQRSIMLEQQLKEFEKQVLRSEARNRSMSASIAINNKPVISNKQNNTKIMGQISNILKGVQNKSKKRDAGKLLNHSFSHNNSVSPSPKNIKPMADDVVLEQVSNLVRRIGKYEQLCQSIIEMHNKITKKSIGNDELKSIWKWLKELGHNYNITQKWKKMLADLLNMSECQRIQELSIDEVLQKTVIELHRK